MSLAHLKNVVHFGVRKFQLGMLFKCLENNSLILRLHLLFDQKYKKKLL